MISVTWKSELTNTTHTVVGNPSAIYDLYRQLSEVDGAFNFKFKDICDDKQIVSIIDLKRLCGD